MNPTGDVSDHRQPAFVFQGVGEEPIESLPDPHIHPTTPKRKNRSQKVCKPCRLRKVKCTYESPCETCVERGHPQLCEYTSDQPSKRLHIAALGPPSDQVSGPFENWEVSKQEWDAMGDCISGVEKSLSDLQLVVNQIRDDLASWGRPPASNTREQSDLTPSTSPPVNKGLSANNHLTGDSVYLGGNSVPAMVTALASSGSDNNVQEILGQSVLPIFGLDNESATYPFVDLWGIPCGSSERIDLLCKLLPSDVEVVQIFKQYRDTAHVIYPGVVDIASFESDILSFLGNRRQNINSIPPGSSTTQIVYGQDLHWLGLLFAVLASGVQCSDLPQIESRMQSQVYVCGAYECLRIINYLSRTTILDLQNLLILGNVISNSMNAGIAWVLLGLTIRLAQSLGLHNDPPSSDPSMTQSPRSRIWWQIIWQDSLLSITYDRSSPSSIVSHHVFTTLTSELSYIKYMRRLSVAGLIIVRQRMVKQRKSDLYLEIVTHCDRINEYEKHAAPHLVDIEKCKSMREQLEYWNLFLHRSYLLSELCRPAISHITERHPHDLGSNLRSLCINSLTNTVDAFIGMQNITSFAKHSWAGLHRALSCALLLSILGEFSRNERAQTLVSRFTIIIEDMVNGVDPKEHSGPLTRSVVALRKLNAGQSAQAQNTSGIQFNLYDPVGAEQFDPNFSSQSSTLGNISSGESLSSTGETSPYLLLNSILWGEQVSDDSPGGEPYPVIDS